MDFNLRFYKLFVSAAILIYFTLETQLSNDGYLLNMFLAELNLNPLKHLQKVFPDYNGFDAEIRASVRKEVEGNSFFKR